MGFYRFDEDGTVLFSDTSVYFPDGTAILACCHEEYEYPYQGWAWFESREAAYGAHGLPVPQESPTP